MTAVDQAAALSRRSLVGTARQPAVWLPGLFFPLMLAAVYSSQFAKAVDLPGFPYPDATFLDFMLVASVLQGVSFGSIGSAAGLALDIENGFMDRLLSSPVSRSSILVGRLAGGMGFAITQTLVLVTVFLVFGAQMAGGVASVVTLAVVAALLALGLGGLGSAIALKTGSQEVVQSIFPVVFIFIFISSAFFPVELMEGWYGAIAEQNPITWVIDPTRELTVVGFDLATAVEAVAVAAGIGAIGVVVAFLQLRRRMATL